MIWSYLSKDIYSPCRYLCLIHPLTLFCVGRIVANSKDALGLTLNRCRNKNKDDARRTNTRERRRKERLSVKGASEKVDTQPKIMKHMLLMSLCIIGAPVGNKRLQIKIDLGTVKGIFCVDCS